ncbi:MAG TPA: hypothetical protein DIT07_05515 [Sphingobacteriaceae bacterium]|nr:hypothetical protein [Sphingobacteriaceae bacterium]
MKVVQSLVLLIFCITACTNSNNNSTETHSDTTKTNKEPLIETLCFLRTEGLKQQDTAYVQLVINGDKITGVFANIPYEKDSRIGTILGTKQDHLIKGIWVYMQEGMQDTLDVEFKLDKDILMQKNYSMDMKTGRQFLSDTSEFTMKYKNIDCAKLPERLKSR